MMTISPMMFLLVTVMVEIPTMIIRLMLPLETSMIVVIVHLIMIMSMPFGVLIISSPGILFFKVYLYPDLRRNRIGNKASTDDHDENK